MSNTKKERICNLFKYDHSFGISIHMKKGNYWTSFSVFSSPNRLRNGFSYDVLKIKLRQKHTSLVQRLGIHLLVIILVMNIMISFFLFPFLVFGKTIDFDDN